MRLKVKQGRLRRAGKEAASACPIFASEAFYGVLENLTFYQLQEVKKATNHLPGGGGIYFLVNSFIVREGEGAVSAEFGLYMIDCVRLASGHHVRISCI